jgi:hypothetical protein
VAPLEKLRCDFIDMKSSQGPTEGLQSEERTNEEIEDEDNDESKLKN